MFREDHSYREHINLQIILVEISKVQYVQKFTNFTFLYINDIISTVYQDDY